MFAHRLFQNLESLRLQLSSLLRSNPLSISEIRITQRGPGQREWPLPAHRRHVAHRPGGERTICACPAEADAVRRKSAAASRSEHGTTVLHFKKELNPGEKSMVAQDNTDADVLDGNQPWKPWKSSGDQFGRSRADKSLPATGDTNPLSPKWPIDRLGSTTPAARCPLWSQDSAPRATRLPRATTLQVRLGCQRPPGELTDRTNPLSFSLGET